jgi:hypothetical protein
MEDAFVPLLLSPGKTKENAGSGFRLKVMPQPAAGAACHAPPPATPTHPPPAGHSSAEPVVTVEKAGERITGIRIQCGCGQVIELACVY